ncbi:von Willebrand factor A domain-containing protein 5A [Tritrichomonas musculus]|uniref:von Willebrand factor A domain-containing protein 5A n=1 Tax=Tritrichomonas musculus TaxID=1915356 RepID=A0ABR2H3B0_9EUKA
MSYLFGKHHHRSTENSPSFGTMCFIQNNTFKMTNAESVKIKGVQHGLIVNFEIIQTFYHTEKSIQEVRYIIPNDHKFCIYGITFSINEKIIETRLKPKEEAQLTYTEAVNSGKKAVYAANNAYGLTEIQVGNIEPNEKCRVIINAAFTAQGTIENKFFIKFPLDVYTPSGSVGCLDAINSNFSFKIQCDTKNISKVTSNVESGTFDELQKIFSIQGQINEKSIIINFETKENIQSSILIPYSNSVKYDYCAITIASPPSSKIINNNEFIFVVDVSGSMYGDKILRASECLDLFIHSIPPGSYFNIYLFESKFQKVFNKSVQYTEETAQKGLEVANNLNNSHGGTNIFDPLSDIFADQNRHGQRQIFIMTDGEVENSLQIIQLISKNSKNNRCFTIGIGNFCDAGLVEGMAKVSGGKSDFVSDGDMLSEKVIPQLKCSLVSPLSSIEIHLEGENNNSFLVSPFPIQPISQSDAKVVYLRKEKSEGQNNSPFENGVLVSGAYNDEAVDFPIEKVDIVKSKSVSRAIEALFAFNYLNDINKRYDVSQSEKEMAIQTSISSGVLCKFTAYIGVSTKSKIDKTIDDLRYKSKQDEERAKKELNKAIAFKKAGNAKKALNCLKMKLIIDSSIESVNKMISNLEYQQRALNDPTFMFKQSPAIANSSQTMKNFEYTDEIGDKCDEIGDKCDEIGDKCDEIGDKCDEIGDKCDEIDESLFQLTNDQVNNDDVLLQLYDDLDVSEAADDVVNNNNNNELMAGFDSDKKVGKNKTNVNAKNHNDNGEIDELTAGFDSNKKVEKSKTPKIQNSNKPAVTKKSNDNFNFMSITHLQRIEGFWEDLNALNKILGTKINSINGVKLSDKITEKNCVATILAIAALRARAPSIYNSWMMIEQKAINWLKKKLKGINIEQIIAEIQKAI